MTDINYSACPIHNPLVQNDPDTDIFLSSIGITPEYKLVAFLSVCIIARLLLAGLAQVYSDQDITPYIVLAVSTFAVLTLWSNLHKNQWWSRKTHLIMAVLLVLASSIQIYSNKRDLTIAYLLYADVIIGLSTFAYVYYSC